MIQSYNTHTHTLSLSLPPKGQLVRFTHRHLRVNLCVSGHIGLWFKAEAVSEKADLPVKGTQSHQHGQQDEHHDVAERQHQTLIVKVIRGAARPVLVVVENAHNLWGLQNEPLSVDHHLKQHSSRQPLSADHHQTQPRY